MSICIELIFSIYIQLVIITYFTKLVIVQILHYYQLQVDIFVLSFIYHLSL